MNKLQKLLRSLDRFQQKHRLLAFIIAVIKKYDEDSAGRQAALLTYYSFLSIFPLLLILTTALDSIIGYHGHVRSVIIKGITNYFPLLGNQLSMNVHRIHSTGLALVLGLLFTLYGTRGVANAFTRGVQDIWDIPKSHRAAFPKSLYKSMFLVVFGGAGLIVASVIASLASSAGKGIDFRILSIAINFFILFWLFRLLLDLSLPAHIPLKETRIGAAAAAIGLIIVQLLGGYILAHELKHLNALYSYFAVTLSLLFWLYMQSQVLYFAIETALVSSRKKWPVTLTN